MWGSVGGPSNVCYSTLKQQVHKLFNGTGERKKLCAPATPTTMHITCQLNETRAFSFGDISVSLVSYSITSKSKTSLSTSSRNYKRTRQLGCFCCLPILLAKRISRTIIIKLRPRQSVKMSKFVEDRKRWCLSKMLSMRYQSKIKRFTNNTPHPKSHKLGNKEGTRKRRHTTAKTVLSTHKFS